jgi:general secretion pathway protein J
MKYSRAFTLLEMIVAIAIFAVIATVSYASLNRFLDYRDVLKTEIQSMKKLQLAFSLMEQDIRFMSERMVRDGYGDPEPLLMINNLDVAGELIRFTTARRNVYLPDTSVLRRTAYRWENGDFVRINWQVLDRDQDSSETRHLLLPDIESVSVNVLQTVDGVVQSLSSWEHEDRLPDGVECLITMSDGKKYRRIFEVKHASVNDSELSLE